MHSTYSEKLVSHPTVAETIKTCILTKQLPAVADCAVLPRAVQDGPLRNINVSL